MYALLFQLMLLSITSTISRILEHFFLSIKQDIETYQGWVS